MIGDEARRPGIAHGRSVRVLTNGFYRHLLVEAVFMPVETRCGCCVRRGRPESEPHACRLCACLRPPRVPLAPLAHRLSRLSRITPTAIVGVMRRPAATTPPPDSRWRDDGMSHTLIQACQVLVTLVFAPLISGVLLRLEAMVQSRHGPSILQPYYDLAKLFRKGTAVPETASVLFFAGPVLAFAAYLTIPLLIPVLTTYPLPLATMGDILGGAFLFALGSFFVAVSAVDSGDIYAGLGASRTTVFASLAEPTLI